MKRITLLLVISVCTIFGVLAEKLYLKQDGDVNYMSNDAFVAAWCWGGVSSNWGIFTQVPNEPTLAVADIPNGTTGIKIVRFAASVTTPDWNSEIWNKTGDISKPTDQNTITLNAWDNATGGTWSNYISVEPSVEFTLSGYYLLTETVTLMATAENVTNPIYIYSVKQGESPGFDPLDYMVKTTHKAGLQFHAWINPLRIQVNNRPDFFCKTNVYFSLKKLEHQQRFLLSRVLRGVKYL